MRLHIHHLGLQAYDDIWHDMQQFTENRDEHTDDEIWFVQHPSVYTLGKNGKSEHILNAQNIPVINTTKTSATTNPKRSTGNFSVGRFSGGAKI